MTSAPFTNNWIVGGTNAAGQRWLDVKALAVDRDEQYLYVLEMQWVRRIEIATRAMMLLSGQDSSWLATNTYSDGFGIGCQWSHPSVSLPKRGSTRGISSMALTRDGSALFLYDRVSIVRKVDTATGQCQTIAGLAAIRGTLDQATGTSARFSFVTEMALDATQPLREQHRGRGGDRARAAGGSHQPLCSHHCRED